MTTRLLWPVLLGFVLALAAFAGPQSVEASSHRVVTQHSGNPTCGDLIPGSVEVLRIEAPLANTTYSGSFGFTVTLTNVTSTSFDFTNASLPVAGVFVKGGPQGLLYRYTPPVTADTGLTAGTNPRNGQLYGISHISFCVIPVLSVSKDAATSWDRDWTWSIEKSVVPTTAGPVEPGDTVNVTWTIDVTRSGPVDSNFAVTGSITISNPWPIAATGVSVADDLDDGTTATVDCPATTVAAGGSMTCTYEAAPETRDSTLNTATVTTTGGPGGGTATAPVVWSATPTNETNECAVITDDRHSTGFPFGSDPICASASISYGETITVPSTFECPGQYTVVNLAIVTPNDGGPTDQDDATVVIDVECAPPGGEGCTPGFWRQEHHFVHWTGYLPTDNYSAIFGVSATGDPTLFEAVTAIGGGENALLRHSVAALLNAANPAVDYAYTEAEIIAMVQAAYSSGDFETYKDLLAAANEAGCELGVDPGDV